MKIESIIKIIINRGLQGILIIIGVILCIINRNVGVYFLFNTFLLYVFCVHSIALTYSLIRKNDVQPVILMIVIVYLFIGLPPVIKFYMDIPDFFTGNYEIVEGRILDSASRRAYYDVMIEDKEIPFWGLLIGYKDFPQGSIMRIYYLKRSGIGIDFEMINDKVSND